MSEDKPELEELMEFDEYEINFSMPHPEFNIKEKDDARIAYEEYEWNNVDWNFEDEN